jgi:ribosomal-protein-alanine N-acetyltransferase
MTALIIQKMQSQDLDAVYELNCRAFRNPWSRQGYANRSGSNAETFVDVAYMDNDFAGYAACLRTGGDAELLQLAVSPQHRRCGIAGQLLNFVSDGLHRDGVIRLYLEVRSSNRAARNLYRKYGFISVGKRPGYYTDDSEDALLMSKYLQEG